MKADACIAPIGCEHKDCTDCPNAIYNHDEDIEDEPLCVICGGEGTVDGQDYFDFDEDEYRDPFTTCPSCHGSGLAKDMTFC